MNYTIKGFFTFYVLGIQASDSMATMSYTHLNIVDNTCRPGFAWSIIINVCKGFVLNFCFPSCRDSFNLFWISVNYHAYRFCLHFVGHLSFENHEAIILLSTNRHTECVCLCFTKHLLFFFLSKSSVISDFKWISHRLL